MVESEIYVKLEYLNPGGSIKDRIGCYMLQQAVKNGDLKPGGTIIEGTSGNTGVGLAMFANIHGYKCIFVLADKQSQEKINNLRAFGAKVVVCPTNVEPEDPKSYYSVSKRLSETIPNSFYVNQYDNLTNRETHVKTTGPEIFEQTQGDFDVFMAGVGTGGTITGTAEFLKSKMPNLKVVGVDFIPGNYNFDLIDSFVTVGDKESFVMTRELLSKEAIYAGGSSGAAVVGAIKYAQTLDKPEKILVILPDSGNRYSSKIYNDDWMRDNGYNDYTFNVTITEVLRSLGKGENKFISIEDNSTIGDAINLMKDKDISQVPVYGKGQLKGVVQEKHLLRPVFEGELKLSDTISLALGQDFLVVDSEEHLSKVSDALLNKKVVMVTKNNEIVDILTHIDILQFISLKGTY